jgi:hypothetical protein
MAESEGRIYYEPRISSQTRHNGGMGEDGRFGSKYLSYAKLNGDANNHPLGFN